MFYRLSSSPKLFPQVGRPQGPQGRPQGRSKVAVEQRGKPSGLVNFQSYKTIFIVFPLWECFWIYIFSKIWRTNTLDMVNRGIVFFEILALSRKNLTKN